MYNFLTIIIVTFTLQVRIYEAQTLLGLGVSWCWIRIDVRHDTYDYTKIYHFLKLLSVSVSLSVLYMMFVFRSVLHRLEFKIKNYTLGSLLCY